jgi:hypothetical protein
MCSCGSGESAHTAGGGNANNAQGGNATGTSAGANGAGVAGTSGSANAGSSAAGSAGSDASEDAGAAGENGVGGSGGMTGPLPADPCTAQASCPAGEWINVTPPDLQYPEFGPGPVVKNPGKPSDLYMGGGGDGLWKSSDYGNTWSKINDSIGYIPMGLVVAVAPTEPATIWAAGYKFVQKSIDDGASFEMFDFDFPDSLYSIQVDPYDSQHLISGLHEVDGIVESIDGGESWQYVGTSGFPSGGKSWYVFFLDTGEAATTAQSWFAIAQDGGSAVKTADGGDSWVVPAGVQGLQHAHGNAQIFQQGQSVFVAGVSGEGGDGMYKSTDFGDSFVKVTDGALSIAWGSDSHVYGMWAWACAGCDLGSGFTVAPLPAGDTWTKPEVPTAMNIGANHITVTSDGTHTIFVGTMWSAGVWRYVEE